MLGGSSAINGLAFVPPSPADIDAWARLGNPKWSWAALEPYLRKTYTVSSPEPKVCPDIGVDSQNQASGPLQVTYPPFEDKQSLPLLRAWIDAFKERGYEYVGELLAEKTVGTRVLASTIDPTSGHRSSADSQYAMVASQRANVTIQTGATVRRVLFSASSPEPIAKGVEVSVDGQRFTVSAHSEVILAAGALHTPKLLELSGIGDRNRLSSLGIPPLVGSPNVGENLQNHLMSVLPIPLNPLPNGEEYNPGIKALAFVRLGEDDQEQLLSQYPPSNNTHDTVIRSIIQHPDEASACMFLGVVPGDRALLGVIPCLPFSHGSTHISSADPDEKPRIDPRFFYHELDIEVMARHFQSLHQLPNDPAFQPVFQHGASTADLETVKKMLREAAALTTTHTCGTAGMRPWVDGGVVDQDLNVYGTKNLRVVDASVFPLIPHTNPMATVYAVAERAADLIRE